MNALKKVEELVYYRSFGLNLKIKGEPNKTVFEVMKRWVHELW